MFGKVWSLVVFCPRRRLVASHSSRWCFFSFFSFSILVQGVYFAGDCHAGCWKRCPQRMAFLATPLTLLSSTADMVSKSANYCFCNRERNTGLLLLGEVALGELYEKKGAEYVQKLPPGTACVAAPGNGDNRGSERDLSHTPSSQANWRPRAWAARTPTQARKLSSTTALLCPLARASTARCRAPACCTTSTLCTTRRRSSCAICCASSSTTSTRLGAVDLPSAATGPVPRPRPRPPSAVNGEALCVLLCVLFPVLLFLGCVACVATGI